MKGENCYILSSQVVNRIGISTYSLMTLNDSFYGFLSRAKNQT